MLIEWWLEGRSPHTRRAYEADIRSFMAAVKKPVTTLTESDVAAWFASLVGLAPASRARRIGAIKSLLIFAERRGYLPSNIGTALRVAAVTPMVAVRVLDRKDILRLISLEPDPRNHALLRLTYVAGLRISEICALRWRHAEPRATTGLITIVRRGKSREIVLPTSIWDELIALRCGAPDEAAVFCSAKRGALDPSQVHRIVKRAAQRAGLPHAVSAHYLRRAHISHALSRGAPPRLVQVSVGHSDLRVTLRYGRGRRHESSATYLSD